MEVDVMIKTKEFIGKTKKKIGLVDRGFSLNFLRNLGNY